MQPAITWATQIPGAPSNDACLLVATADGRLHLIAVDDGRKLTEPLRARPGVQPGGRCNALDLLLCFDRYTIYALRSDQPRLAWQFGQAPAQAAVFDDDPETLTAWVAVQPTTAGVLALSSDGRLLLLNAGDGRLRRQFDLGPLAAARLHANEKRAAVLWRSGGQTRAAFLDLKLPQSQLRTRELGAWPLFSTLLEDGLLVVDTGSAAIWLPEEPPRTCLLPAMNVRATSLAVWSGGPTGAPTTDQTAPVLLLADGQRIVAVDPRSGQSRWTVDAGVDSADVVALWTHQNRCLVQYEHGVVVVALENGRCLARHSHAGDAKATAAHLDDNRLYILYVPTDRPDAPVELVVLPLLANRAAAASAPVSRLSLPPMPNLRACLWIDKRVVLVAADELRAYALPVPP